MESTTAKWLQRASRALVAVVWLGTLLVALGRMYIDKFRSEVARMVEQKGLTEYVKFTDKHLRFLDEA